MNKQEYRKAKRYAHKVTSSRDNDLVHDAYLVWFNKTGRDLFDEPNATIVSVVKNLHLKSFQTHSFMWRGEIYGKKYERLDDTESNFALENIVTPESILLSKEQFEILNANLSEFDKRTLQLITDGYLLKEIEGIQERSNPTITASVKRIKKQVAKLYMSYTNPFNGSRTVIKKQISEKIWNERKDHSEFEMEDESEYCQLYVHKESKEGWLVKISKPVGSEFYIQRLEDNKKPKKKK